MSENSSEGSIKSTTSIESIDLLSNDLSTSNTESLQNPVNKKLEKIQKLAEGKPQAAAELKQMRKGDKKTNKRKSQAFRR